MVDEDDVDEEEEEDPLLGSSGGVVPFNRGEFFALFEFADCLSLVSGICFRSSLLFLACFLLEFLKEEVSVLAEEESLCSYEWLFLWFSWRVKLLRCRIDEDAEDEWIELVSLLWNADAASDVISFGLGFDVVSDEGCRRGSDVDDESVGILFCCFVVDVDVDELIEIVRKWRICSSRTRICSAVSSLGKKCES